MTANQEPDNICECGKKVVEGIVFCKKCMVKVMAYNKSLEEKAKAEWLFSCAKERGKNGNRANNK